MKSWELEKEDKKRSFYRKATRSFSYNLSVPGDIDQKKEPEASFKDGVMTITFSKTKAGKGKKIKVKKG